MHKSLSELGPEAWAADSHGVSVAFLIILMTPILSAHRKLCDIRHHRQCPLVAVWHVLGGGTRGDSLLFLGTSKAPDCSQDEPPH